MKKLYSGMLLIFLGIMFGASFVRGDIIDPSPSVGWPDPVEWDDSVGTPKGTSTDICENYIVCFFSGDVWFNIVDGGRLVSLFLICLLLLLSLSIFPLYNIFVKLGEKGSKSLIPIKNLYYFGKLLGTKRISVIWWILAILRMFLIRLGDYFMLNTCLRVFDIYGVYQGVNSSTTCGLHNICNIVSLCPIIFVLLAYDYSIIISFYRLFRRFGWKKGNSILGTIFFPVGACVLGFGKFEPQLENLESEKEKFGY